MRRTLNEALVGYGIIMLAIAIDLLFDWNEEGGFDSSMAIELLVWAVSAAMLIRLYLHQRKVKRHVDSLNQLVSQQRQRLSESEARYRAASGQLSELIQSQLEKWGLSRSEKEIALLLIKGLSLDEIAEVRGTKAKTIRQQASSIYRKAGLAGRHELAAYFLEDLLTPPEQNRSV